MLEKHWVLMTINKIYFYGFEYDWYYYCARESLNLIIFVFHKFISESIKWLFIILKNQKIFRLFDVTLLMTLKCMQKMYTNHVAF